MGCSTIRRLTNRMPGQLQFLPRIVSGLRKEILSNLEITEVYCIIDFADVARVVKQVTPPKPYIEKQPMKDFRMIFYGGIF